MCFHECLHTGKRNVGAPKMRWKDCCKRDMQQFGIKFQNQSGEIWASQAINRRQWALLLRNGMKVHTLFSNDKAKLLQAMRHTNPNYSNRAKKQQQMIAAVKKKTAKSTSSKQCVQKPIIKFNTKVPLPGIAPVDNNGPQTRRSTRLSSILK